jgi:hypothetical protein
VVLEYQARHLAYGAPAGFGFSCAREIHEMSLLCLFGRHKPLIHSVSKSQHGYRALCEFCARPLERSAAGPWQASEPLDMANGKPA